MTLPTEAEQIRQKYLAREANLRGFGWLIYFQAGLTMLVAAVMPFVMFVEGMAPDAEAFDGEKPGWFAIWLVTTVFGALGYWWWVGARKLRQLNRSARVPVGVCAFLTLLNFPIGTIIGGSLLVMLFGRKGSYVLSPEYRAIVEQTPHIKYKRSLITKVFVGLLVAVLLLVLIAALIGFVSIFWQSDQVAW